LAENQELLATINLGTGPTVRIAQYHGGVPERDTRRDIRKAMPEFVFTNPEMLSRAFLPLALDVDVPGVGTKMGGGAWEYFFRRLRYVILDECHELRGVYGSHVANLLRRLRRVCALAENPDANQLRYVLCSATIREPAKFAERLTGVKPALVVDRQDDTSERYPKKLILLRRREPNQPMKDFAKGVLGKVFSNRRLRTIAFQENIPAIQELYHRFQATLQSEGFPPSCFQVFAATFLPEEKVDKLEDLRSGKVPGVVTTSALALGIDIGPLSCSALITYPGSMAKAWQMLGRAGRRGPGLQLFLLGDGYLDRYWEEHPKEFLDQDKHLEELVIMPDNRHILAEHIAAACFDHPLEPTRDEAYFGVHFREVLREILERGDVLAASEEDDQEYFELTDGGRVFRIALRGTGAFKVPVYRKGGTKPILEEDQVRAIRRLFPGAIFVHNARFYRVLQLRYEREQKRTSGQVSNDARPFYAVVEEDSSRNVTVPIVRTEIDCLDDRPGSQRNIGPLTARLGRIRVKTSVDQYYQIPYDPMEPGDADVAVAVSGDEETPTDRASIRKYAVQREPGKTPISHVYETAGMWVAVPADAFSGIEDTESQYRALFSIGKAVTRAIPLLHYSGPEDLLFTPFSSHPAADNQSALFIYERTRGGVGLAERTYERFEELLNNALYEVLEGCKRCNKTPESAGCPSCIADISGLHDRGLAIQGLRTWLETLGRDSKTTSRRKAHHRSESLSTPEAALASVGFERITQIGEGGMAKVFKASRNGQEWALKMAASEKQSREQCSEIAQEGLRQKRIAHQWREHPTILPVKDVITIGSYVFLQLEYADGGSLEDKIGALGYVPRGARGGQGRALATVRDILPVIDALAHLHDCGWVHRDIKPANILLVGSTPKLSDFGIARQQAAGDEKTAGAGTPGYAAPGQIATQSAPDYRDDVYSIGVLLKVMLTGRKPRQGNSGVVLPQAVPEKLRSIIKKAKSPKREDRYASARVLHTELESLFTETQKRKIPSRSSGKR
jgi:DEAD/DEAH box helicase domain-containing protein